MGFLLSPQQPPHCPTEHLGTNSWSRYQAEPSPYHLCNTHPVPGNVLNALLMLPESLKQTRGVSTINTSFCRGQHGGTGEVISLLMYLAAAKRRSWHWIPGIWRRGWSLQLHPLHLSPSQLHDRSERSLRNPCRVGALQPRLGDVSPWPHLKGTLESFAEAGPTVTRVTKRGHFPCIYFLVGSHHSGWTTLQSARE